MADRSGPYPFPPLALIGLTGVVVFGAGTALGLWALVPAAAAAVAAPIYRARRGALAGTSSPARHLNTFESCLVAVLALVLPALLFGLRAVALLALLAAGSAYLYPRSSPYKTLLDRRRAYLSVCDKIGAYPADPWPKWTSYKRDGSIAVRYDPKTLRAHDPKVRREVERAIAHRIGSDVVGEWPARASMAYLTPVPPLPDKANLSRGTLKAHGRPGVLVLAATRDPDKPLVVNLDRAPHGLITGTTGAGKSESLRTVVVQLQRWAKVDLIDTKRSDFLASKIKLDKRRVRRVSHLDGIVEVIAEFRAEIERRLDAVEAGANPESFERRALVVDEASTLAVLLRTAAVAAAIPGRVHPATSQIGEVGRIGREVRCHLILGLQRADVSLLPAPDGGELRDNLGWRLACGRLLSDDAAKMALSSGDAREAAQDLDDNLGRAVVEVLGKWSEVQVFKGTPAVLTGPKAEPEGEGEGRPELELVTA